MSCAVAKLVPLIQPEESGFQRPTLTLLAHQPLQLGRNVATQISNVEISRHLATIEYKDNQVTFQVVKEPNRHSVRVCNQPVDHQDPIVLKDRDTISLRGAEYAYQVQYCLLQQQGNNESDVLGAGLLDESCCPICMELLVDSTALNPCGHIFCASCITNSVTNGECPTCRQHFQSQIRIRTLDNIIWKLVNNQEFDPDEVTSYLKRSGRTLSDAQRQQMSGGDNNNNSQPPRKRRRRHQQQPQKVSPVYATFDVHAGNSEADAICLDD